MRSAMLSASAAAAAFADHRRDDRDRCGRKLVQAPRDGLRLRALFGPDARIGPFGIDERHDRQPDAVRQFR